jgi:uncharacterized protein (UPF0218 family)
LGLLIQGSFNYTAEKLRELVNDKKPEKLIAVGDEVSRNIIRKGIPLDVAIVDDKVMRKPIAPVRFQMESTYRVNNPSGTLADASWQVIREAIEGGGRAKVLVEGEEDLLTLVAVLSAPESSMVVYGQPGKGMVVIDVTEDSKRKVCKIVERMDNRLSKD